MDGRSHHGDLRGVEEIVGLVVQGLGREVDGRTQLELGQERKARHLNK